MLISGCIDHVFLCLDLRCLCLGICITYIFIRVTGGDILEHFSMFIFIWVSCIGMWYIYHVSDADGWVYFSQGSGTDSGSKYTIINRAMMFTAAQKECHLYGGHLPFVKSPREQLFLEDFITHELMDPGELAV